MQLVRRAVAWLGYALVCVLGFLAFAVVLALIFGLLYTALHQVVIGFHLQEKGLLAGLIQIVAPLFIAVEGAYHLVLPRVFPLLDRLENWGGQS